MSETYSYIKTNRDYFAQQYPDLADVFKPKAKSQVSLAQPTPHRKPPKALPLAEPRWEGESLVITLPLPPKELSPNGRAHWARKAEATKAVRNAVKVLVQVSAPKEWWGCSVRLDVTRWAAKPVDSDNLWGCLKAARDGIADGLMTTDAQFELGTITQHTGRSSNGLRQVEIRVSPTSR